MNRDKPSVAFLMSILDAIAVCAKAESCPDDRKTVECLLQLEGLIDSKKVRRCNSKSLAMALDHDLEPFGKNYQISEKGRLNEMLRRFECQRLLRESKAASYAVNIPKQIVTTTAQRLKAHEMLLKLTPEQLAEAVIQGFEKFPIMENYEVPDAVDKLIQKLASAEEVAEIDMATNLQETAEFIIDQALKRMANRAKFTPLSMQAEFIAMLINTLDETKGGFEEARGPVTRAAIMMAMDPDHPMVAFLSDWASYEFVRNSPVRYENLLCEIFISLASLEVKEDDNPVSDFVGPLPYIPQTIYPRLSRMCEDKPEQSANILTAVNEFLLQAPASRGAFLRSLLELSINQDERINTIGIQLVRDSFYKKEEKFKEEINNFASQQLRDVVASESANQTLLNANAMLKMFFSILELNAALFLDIMEVYGSVSDNLQKELRNRLELVIPHMQFDKGVVARALKLANSERRNLVLIHFYLAQLAKTLSFLPLDFVEMLTNKFKEDGDARYLIPIIPYLPANDFISYLPAVLSMKQNAMRTAIVNLLKAGKPIPPTIFLIELHKFPETSEIFSKAVDAMKICFKQTDIVTYQTAAKAVDTVVRQSNLDMIMETLLEMAQTHKDSIRYIVIHLLQNILMSKGIYEKARQWELMKQLLDKTKPLSLKVVVALPPDKVQDFVDTYPDIRGMVLNQAKSAKKQQIVELLSA